MDSASQDSNDQGSNSGNSNENEVKKIVWKWAKKRPVRVAIHSLEISFEINLMPFFLIPKKFHILTLAYA
jgi:hypothetical protein